MSRLPQPDRGPTPTVEPPVAAYVPRPGPRFPARKKNQGIPHHDFVRDRGVMAVFGVSIPSSVILKGAIPGGG